MSKGPSNITKVDGIDYSPEGIQALRQELIQLREETFQHWPDSVMATVILTHSIALLAYLVELINASDN